MRRALLAIALLISGAYAAGLGSLFYYQRSLIFPAPSLPWPEEAGFETVSYRTEDGLTLRGLYRAAQPGQPTIVFFHGNGDSLSGSLVSTELYAAAGHGLLLVEYRGYGGNPGAPDEAGLYQDGRAARGWLAAEGIQPERQILIGYSLGTGVAAQLALEQAPARLILIAPYTSLPDVVTHRFGGLVPTSLVKDHLDTAAKIARIGCPVLIMHDRDDASVPAAQGEALARASKGAKLLLFNGHGHQLGFSEEAQQAGLTWLQANQTS
ncbi:MULTISPECIES: alpha/beta fold hydrolase [unclassified Novosphingobium]|uniref:alpha/beta hydrolase n=1 Tax=unclassified Novosphingobium TaxID=2644732 RepID=UPI000ECEBD81|nr:MULTISPECIES: alpha/beta fold hydrolase [unclassified Novosphingobium]HCF25063.1 alpha/beta hydrolase [Novosphingobium sp.]HQV02321.1 alpha/beta fold hydrolase [Novosphingobium sp.]